MSIPIVIFMDVNEMDVMFMRITLVAEILVDVRVNFNSLVGLIYEQIQLDDSVELSVLLDFGKNNVETMVPKKKDNDVAWYLAFSKDTTSRHPLVAHESVNILRRYVRMLRYH